MPVPIYKTVIRAMAAATAVIVAVLSVACSRGGGAPAGTSTFTSLADFSGKKIASEAGSVFSQFIDRIIPNVEHRYYLTFMDIVAALHTGAVDAIAIDMPVALYLVAHNKEFAVFPYVISVDSYGFAVPKGSRLCEDANEALHRLKESGVIDDAEMYWFAADTGNEKEMPQPDHRPDFDGSAGTIRFGCENTLFPMTYTSSDGKQLGFDIDILNRIAYELNMKVEIVPMSFGELLPALLAGRLDMAGGSMTITEERQERVDFIGPYFEGGTALVVRNKNMPRK
jgi:polar amino acid transport system substrate-binding protein